ncbi:MAG: BMP family ABC transporter substrate-binding protein [Desulfobacteraceae bacterium]|nr:BMP family ABC transporter substrate-binding protein [Desulfobacteraceae bacterium]
MKRYLKICMAAMIISGLLLSGCGKKEKQDPDSTSQSGVMKVGMVSDLGGVMDQSFNESAWEGLLRAQNELGIKIGYLESNNNSDYGPNLESLTDAGNSLIWSIGFMMGDAALEAAKANPEQKYGIVDMAYGNNTPPNLISVLFKSEQASFLVGYIAGRMTKTNKVGFIGGIKGFIIDSFDYGFHAGVNYANADVKILRQYVESFSDAAKGKSIANQMYQQGADIVFHASGPVGDGVIEAAKEKSKWAIGVDKDQNSLAPDNVLTSAIKRVDNAIFNIVSDLQKGKFAGGATVVYGLKEGGVDIAPSSDKHVPKEILSEVAELKTKIIRKEIVIPYNAKTYEKFYIAKQ